jgi:membrane-associated phospholipid phosphatase
VLADLIRWRVLMVMLLFVLVCLGQIHEPAQATFLILNRAFALWPEAGWANLTMLGDTTVALCLISPLLLLRQAGAIWVALCAIPFGGLASWAFKTVFATSRPGALIHDLSMVQIGPVLQAHSFPSGHTLSAFAIAAALLAYWRWRGWNRTVQNLSPVLLGLALLIGCSRVACGVHWVGDVAGGACLGWLAGLNGLWLAKQIRLDRLSRFDWALYPGFALAASWLLVRSEAYAQGTWMVNFAGLVAWITCLVVMAGKLTRLWLAWIQPHATSSVRAAGSGGSA